MTGAPEHKLAKFLHSVIKPFIAVTYMLQSSTDLEEKLLQFEFKSKQILVNFDVKSLFTNLPLNETIKLIATKLCSETVDEALKPPINKKIFLKLLKLASQVMFINQCKIFLQIDGVTLSSRLDPTIANFFLADLKTQLLR